MGIIKKVKLWWRSTTPQDKAAYILGIGGLFASGVTCCACVLEMDKTRRQAVKAVEDMHVEVGVKLFERPKGYAEGEEVPSNPTTFGDPRERSQYEMAKDVYDLLEDYYENGDGEMLEAARQELLSLGWDLAILEHKAEEAREKLPEQVHD